MRHLLAASLIVCAGALAQPATAQVEGPPVPVDKAAYHVPVFRNEYVAVVNVYIPPGRAAGYFTPGSRADVPGYTQVVDNERVMAI